MNFQDDSSSKYGSSRLFNDGQVYTGEAGYHAETGNWNSAGSAIGNAGIAVGSALLVIGLGITAEKYAGKAAKGMNNLIVKSAAARGRSDHKKVAERVRQKPGWQSEKTITGVKGEKLRPDALSPSARPVGLKLNTLSGRRQGTKQIKKYKEATGTNGLVVYYNP